MSLLLIHNSLRNSCTSAVLADFILSGICILKHCPPDLRCMIPNTEEGLKDGCGMNEWKITMAILCHNVAAHKTSKSMESEGDGKWCCIWENMNPGLLVLLVRPFDVSFRNKSCETLWFRDTVLFLDVRHQDPPGTCILFSGGLISLFFKFFN